MFPLDGRPQRGQLQKGNRSSGRLPLAKDAEGAKPGWAQRWLLGDLGALGERISGALFLVAGNRGLSRRQRNGPYFRDAREIHMRRPTIREIAKAMGALNITAMGQNGSK